MVLVTTVQEIQEEILDGSCATLGNFDGVHKGHQVLLQRVRDKAHAQGLKSIAITFDPHPLRVLLGKTPPFITLTRQKLELLEQMNLDYVLCLNFSSEIAQLSPEDFVYHYLYKGVNMRQLVVGYDYAFGRQRRGNFALLRKLGQEYGFEVEQIPPVYSQDKIVSSTHIREMIQEGNVWKASFLLGRYYQVQGEVIQGQKRGGKMLGFPTANLKLVDELFPLPGVYAVWVDYLQESLPAVANIGYNPTFGTSALSVEVHLLDFDQDIYGKSLRVHFVKRLRSEKKFSGIGELKEQIQKDVQQGREILEQKPGPRAREEERISGHTDI